MKKTKIVSITLLALIAPTLLAAHTIIPAFASGSLKPASDLYGQLDAQGNPNWNTGTFSSDYPNDLTLGGPVTSAVDTINHRLYIAEWQRIVVYNLTTANLPIDRRADYVIGQVDLFSQDNSGTTSANRFGTITDIEVDPIRNLLFVSDSSLERVLIFNTASLSNNMNASWVIGQSGFDSYVLNDPKSPKTTGWTTSLAYDPTTKYLYVGDFLRVTVFNTSTITNFMDAFAVLGQPNLTSNLNESGANRINPYALALDTQRKRLFVGGDCTVTVFDIQQVTPDENAVNIIGNDNFDGLNPSCSVVSANRLTNVFGLAYDAENDRLFVSSFNGKRVMIFDTSNVYNFMPASAVIGQSDFTSSAARVDRYGFTFIEGLFYDQATKNLYAADDTNNRMLVFNLSNNLSLNVPSATVGAAYTGSISASSDFGSYSFSVTSGSLPSGLTLAANGLFSGTPTQAGTYAFTVTVLNSWGSAGALSEKRNITLTVAEPAAQQTQSSQTTSGSSSTASSASTGLEALSAESETTISASVSSVLPFTLESPSGITENHTVSVATVSESYVDLVIASEPISLRIKIGETKYVDVDKNGDDDLYIRLDAIKNGKAVLVFKKIQQKINAAMPTPTSTKSVVGASAAIENEKSIKLSPLIYIGLGAVLMLASITITFMVLRKKARNI